MMPGAADCAWRGGEPRRDQMDRMVMSDAMDVAANVKMNNGLPDRNRN
jgi:hypothetical protein